MAVEVGLEVAPAVLGAAVEPRVARALAAPAGALAVGVRRAGLTRHIWSMDVQRHFRVVCLCMHVHTHVHT